MSIAVHIVILGLLVSALVSGEVVLFDYVKTMETSYMMYVFGASNGAKKRLKESDDNPRKIIIVKSEETLPFYLKQK